MMSIGYKKVSEMISEEVDKLPDMNERQRTRVEQLCNKIYMLETSSNASSARLIEDLMGELSVAADRLKEFGETR